MLKRLVASLALAVALGSAAWFAWAWATERSVLGWLDARAAEGWHVNHAGVSVSGYPAAFRTRIAELELADPETGWLWTLPEMLLESPTLEPGRFRAVFPGEQALASPAERLTIRADEMTSDLHLRRAADFALDLSDTVLRGVTVESDLGWRTGLAEGQLRMARQEGREATYDTLFEAIDLVPSGPLRARLDPAGLLPDRVATLLWRAEVAFDRPWDLRALEDRRPQMTRLDLAEVNAVWGGMVLRAAGALDVDAAGVPEGALRIRAENWREMVTLAVRAGLVPPRLADTAEGMLGVLAGLSGDPEVIEAALEFRGGRMFLGPLPLGPVPRLALR